MAVKAGWYHAQGDPFGTVRHWNGSAWDTEPTAMSTHIEPAGIGARLAPAAIDLGVWMLVALFLLAVEANSPGPPAGMNPSEAEGYRAGQFAANALVFVVVFALPLQFSGGTIGKLMTGLRVFRRSTGTTPPGFPAVFGRTGLLMVPFVVVTSGRPVLAVSVAAAILIVSIAGIARDPYRRSAFDFIASTRVGKARPTTPPNPPIPMV